MCLSNINAFKRYTGKALHRCSFIPSQCTGWPKMLLNICTASSPQAPDFNLFRPTARCFKFTGHFQTTALTDFKKTLNTVTSKVPHTCSTQLVPISPLFNSHNSYFRYIPNILLHIRLLFYLFIYFQILNLYIPKNNFFWTVTGNTSKNLVKKESYILIYVQKKQPFENPISGKL